jgi:hypothetical protein
MDKSCYEEFEDTKTEFISRKSRRIRNDLQNTKQKTKNWATQTPLPEGELMCHGVVHSSCSTSGTVVLFLKVMNEEVEELWLRQAQYIRGHLWQILLNG